jgi:GNAT superfamily N-acetyltransferase
MKLNISEKIQTHSIYAILEILCNESEKIANCVIYIEFKYIKDMRSGFKFTDIGGSECTILSLYTEKPFRNKGYATYLLKYAIDYCRSKGVHRIVLDDCSDNFKKQNNIYLKCGFRYVEDDLPEMKIIL